MRGRLTSLALVVLLASAVLVAFPAPPAWATTFSNAASIALRDPNFPANPNCSNPGVLCAATAGTYPSNISVSGLSGTVSSVSLSLNNVSYNFSDDIDALLVAPSGQSLIVVAAVGPNTGASEAASNSTLTISDGGTLPTDVTPWGSAPNFKPANFGSYGLGGSVNGFNETYPSPAPAAPWGDPGQNGTNATLANTFDGLNPNGTWSLYVITTAAGDGTGAIAGGWTLNLTTAASAAPTTTALLSAPNPSFTSGTSSSVTLTATVNSSSTVSEGTVNFTDGGVTISGCGTKAVSSGSATCTTTFAAEGNHALQALYSGTTNFGPSNGTLTQRVDNHTTVTGSNYCNSGSIGLTNVVGNGSPYPSRVFVSGLSGTLSHLAVTLNGVTYSQSQDIDALLVGPAGQTLILVAAAGPNSSGAISNVTLTLDDNAAGTLSGSAIWGTPGSTVTSKPVNYGGVNETWGPPAPSGPLGNPGPDGGGTATLATQFNGTNPNGTWSLYVIDTAAGDGTGTIAGGWCASITTGSAAATNTAIASNNNPSFTASPGNTVAFTATVTKASDNSNVGEGSVNFTSNGVTIAGCGASAVAAGQAVCVTAFPAEGAFTIQALYSGDANFGSSNATLTQRANNHTTVTGNNFCNTGTLVLNNPDINHPEIGGTPYPSNIFVTGRPGNLQHLAVTLNGVTYSQSQDIDALLVGPGGQTLILVAAAGPNSGGAIGNVTLTLDDNAAGTLSSSAIWGAPNSAVSSKPVNYGGLNETFPSPAPSGPWGNPGPFGGGSATLGGTYNGTIPNGTWSLYAITTAAGDGTGAFAGGWCLNITSPAPPTLSKAFSPSSIPLHGTSGLTFTVTNPNASSSLTGVGFTDTLPAGLALANPAGESGTCGGGTISAPNGGTAVSLTGATLASSAACTFSVNVTGNLVGSQVNTTSGPTSNEGGTGTPATATLVVVGPPTLTKSFGAASIAFGGQTTLTFKASNPNGSTQLNGIGFTDTLPAGLVVATPNGLTGSCGGGTIAAVAGGGSVSLAGASLAANASCSFTVNVLDTTAGSKVNTTSVVSSNEGGNGAAATATLNVGSGPVQISKSFGAAHIPVGGSTTLSFTIQNPTGNGSATGVAFTDTLPAGLHVSTPNGLTGSCGGGTIGATAGGSSVSLGAATLADGASCTFTVNVTGVTAGVQNNSVTVSSTNGGTGNTATASITVIAPPTLAKSFSPNTVALNGASTLSFTVTNPNGGSALTGVGFTDALPAGVVVSTPNGLAGSCGGGTIGAAAGGTSISLSGATLAANGTCTFSVSVTGTTAGAHTNTTSPPTSTEGGSGTAATATLTVLAGPPMIQKSFGATTIPLHGSTTLSFTITNPLANGTSTGIAFTDSLPAGLVVSTPNGLTGSCGGGTITATAASASVSLSGATLAGGATCTLTVSVTGAIAGVKNNSVTVSSTNGGTGNTANASLTVVAPPTVGKSFGAGSVPVGGTTTLSFTIGNPNATVALSAVGLTDTLPAGLVVATPNGFTGSCGAGTVAAAAGGSTITLTGGTIPAGGSCTFGVNVTGTAAGTKANTTGAVTSTEGGTGSTASASLVVVAPPVIAKAFGASNIALNGTTSLTFTLTNPAANTVPENGVGFNDAFPAGLVVASPNGLTTTCAGGTVTATPGSAAVSASGFTIPVGGSCTIAVNVTGTTGGTLNNSVTVSSTNGGTGNTATATLTVALPPVISKAFGTANLAIGGSTTLSFTVNNPNAGFTLTGVAFTDSLPSGLVVSTPNGLAGSCGGGTIGAAAGSSTVSLTGATLGGGASCTFSVNVTAVALGTQNNAVLVTSANAGPGNIGTASLTVIKAQPAISTQASPGGVVGSTQVHDATTLAGGYQATGTVTFRLYSDAACQTQVFTSTNNLTSGTSATSGLFTPAARGTYYWTAAYSGDANNFAVASPCNAPNESVVIVGLPSSTATQASFGGAGGTAVTDTATVTPAIASGTVTFKLFNNPSCSGAPLFQSTPLVNGGGVATSSSFTPPAAGTYYWTADYSGDTKYNPSSSSCADPNESVTILPAFTRTVTGPTGPITVGSNEVVNVVNAQDSGGLTVNPGGKVVITSSSFSGGIVANGAGFLSICGAQVNASPALTVTNSAANIRIGDNAGACTGNVFYGTVTLTGNHGVIFGVNTVYGNASIDTTTPANTIIKADRVNGTLECSGNNPPPINAGQPNQAVSKLGQCTSL